MAQNKCWILFIRVILFGLNIETQLNDALSPTPIPAMSLPHASFWGSFDEQILNQSWQVTVLQCSANLVKCCTSQLCVVHPFFPTWPLIGSYHALVSTMFCSFFSISVLIGFVLHVLATKPLGPCSLTSKDWWIGLVGYGGYWTWEHLFLQPKRGASSQHASFTWEPSCFFLAKNSTALKSQPFDHLFVSCMQPDLK